MKKIKNISIIVIASLLVLSCATIVKKPIAYQALYLSKGTAETIKDTAIILHKAGKLDDEKYNKIKVLYNSGREATNKVIDMMIKALEEGRDLNEYEQYKQAVIELNEIIKALIEISIENGLIKEEELKLIQGGTIQ